MTTAVALHAADDPGWVDAMLAVLAAELPAAVSRVRGLRSAADLTRITVPGPLSRDAVDAEGARQWPSVQR